MTQLAYPKFQNLFSTAPQDGMVCLNEFLGDAFELGPVSSIESPPARWAG